MGYRLSPWPFLEFLLGTGAHSPKSYITEEYTYLKNKAGPPRGHMVSERQLLKLIDQYYKRGIFNFLRNFCSVSIVIAVNFAFTLTVHKVSRLFASLITLAVFLK
jgi:hypothetical protein